MLCAPAVIVMVAVTAYPVVYAFILSLQRADLRFPGGEQVRRPGDYGPRARREAVVAGRLPHAGDRVLLGGDRLVLGMGLALVMHGRSSAAASCGRSP